MQATDSGVDPRALPMIAFGGAGPVHAYGVARKLGIRKVICPLGAGVTSAIGLLGAPVAADLSTSLPMAVPRWDAKAVQGVLEALAAQGREVVLAQRRAQRTTSASRTPSTCATSARATRSRSRCRSGDPADPAFLDELLVRFHDAYIELYGRTSRAPTPRSSPGASAPAGPRAQVSLSSMRGEAKAVRNPRKGTPAGVLRRSRQVRRHARLRPLRARAGRDGARPRDHRAARVHRRRRAEGQRLARRAVTT